MRRSTLLSLSFAFALAAAAPSQAQSGLPDNPFRDLVHARSMGMGGAFRSLGLGVETVAGNPAAMSLYQHYSLELNGAWDVTQQVAFASAGVMDSSNKLAGGVAYHLVSFGDFANRSLAHLNTLALSMPLLENVFVGGSVHYVFSSGALDANAVTGDAGVVVRLLESLTVGLAGHNLIDTRHPDLATYFTLAGAFSAGPLSVAADARAQYVQDQAPLIGVNAGAEFVLGFGVPLRAGWGRDESGRNFISGGLGYMFEGGAVDVAYRHELTGIGRAVAVTIKLSPG
ncbi:MAG TPA: hypothetical protein VND93_17075 [Myxococcales bacterium]|nr:hypothetical protein [Myxococcales bacterium]